MGRGANPMDILAAQLKIPQFGRLYKQLPYRQRGGEQLVAALRHLLFEDYNLIGKWPEIFEEINIQICVPKDAAHSQPSRRRLTYSSACSSAQICLPEPRSARSGSVSALFAAECSLHSRYQFSNSRYSVGRSSGSGVAFEPSLSK